MQIVLIGSGNVATHLGLALHQANHQIIQVYSRELANAKQLARKIDAEAIHSLDNIVENADLYIISVKDDAIEGVIGALPEIKGMVVHTAGSISVDVLKRFDNYGVFYPFQTFTKEAVLEFSNIPVLVEGNNDNNRNFLSDLAKQISTNVLKASSYQRGQLHIAAVFACNFVNHMYILADEVLKDSGLPFELMHPLIMETAAKVKKISPHMAQTGPASRNDQHVIHKHIQSLEGKEELQSIYKLISNSIINNVLIR